MLLVFASLVSSAPYLLHEERSFKGFMNENGLMFTGEEYHFRLGVFLANKRFIDEHNRADHTYKLGLNQLSHLTPSEYRSLLGFKGHDVKNAAVVTTSRINAPDAINYIDMGYVNPVRDQGACGSCWAFSSIAAVEGFIAKKTGVLPQLSESNLVDCVNTCHGCNGGLMTRAYDYVIKNQGGKFMTAIDYPYVPRAATCKFDASKATAQISKYVSVRYGDEADMKEKVAQYGVACVAMDASHATFHAYKSGIYQDPSCSSYALDHALACVGYGSEGGLDFWIIRNSWASSWGENGYVRIIRNKNNHCGIASMVIIPQ